MVGTGKEMQQLRKDISKKERRQAWLPRVLRVESNDLSLPKKTPDKGRWALCAHLPFIVARIAGRVPIMRNAISALSLAPPAIIPDIYLRMLLDSTNLPLSVFSFTQFPQRLNSRASIYDLAVPV